METTSCRPIWHLVLPFEIEDTIAIAGIGSKTAVIESSPIHLLFKNLVHKIQ